MSEEELKKTQEEVSKELDGKSKEELEAMENSANEELQKQILNDAYNYVWNLMGLGSDYSQEKFVAVAQGIVEEVKAGTKQPFNRWSNEEFALNQNIMIQGYGNFGKDFIENLISQDPASAKVILETAMQSYLELRSNYEELLNALQSMTAAKEEKAEK